jgi:replicative DNA helicase
LSLEPIPQKIVPGFKSAKNYLRSFADLYDRLSTDGLIPPQALDVEQSVLGAMMIDKDAANKVLEILGDRGLEESPFYRESHTVLYRAMVALDARSETIDLLSVTNQLRLDGQLEIVGGPSYLVELTSRVVTTANVESHARIILDKYIARELIRTCEEIKLRAFTGEDDTFELLDQAEGALFRLSESRHRKSVSPIKPLAHATLELLDSIDGKHSGITGVPSGLADLDNLTSGWQKSDLIILAARPSQGKTALSLAFARNAAITEKKEDRVGVAYFSLEMSAMQLVLRLLCSEAKVDMQRARKGQLTHEEWRRIPIAMGRLTEAPIFIDDTPAITPLELRAKCRRLKAQENVGLIVIDYLQLMGSSRHMESREREISLISRSLKALAKELDVPVIALSQLNRSVESRTEKRPMLSDLRESGAIEQDADVVMFIYRPETYGIESVMVKGNQVSAEGVAEVIVGKQRNGPIDDITVSFIKQYARFENYANWPEFTQLPETGGGPAF